MSHVQFEPVPTRICNHCGVNIHIQPPKESGCNHAHYPEACGHCSNLAAYKTTVIAYDIDKISFVVKP